MHPQLLVLPLCRSPARTIFFRPQSHWHSQRAPGAPSDGARSSTTSLPYRSPVRSITVPLLIWIPAFRSVRGAVFRPAAVTALHRLRPRIPSVAGEPAFLLRASFWKRRFLCPPGAQTPGDGVTFFRTSHTVYLQAAHGPCGRLQCKTRVILPARQWQNAPAKVHKNQNPGHLPKSRIYRSRTSPAPSSGCADIPSSAWPMTSHPPPPASRRSGTRNPPCTGLRGSAPRALCSSSPAA